MKRQVFPKSVALNTTRRVEIFSGTAPELGIRIGTFTFAGIKGINRSGSDTELQAKSRLRRAVSKNIALAIPLPRECNGAGGPVA